VLWENQQKITRLLQASINPSNKTGTWLHTAAKACPMDNYNNN